jgi:hypothetical protein
MPKFQVGIGIEQTRSTVIVAEVEADNQDAAEHKAVEYVRALTHLPYGGELSALGRHVEWDDGFFSVTGIDREEPWGDGDYSTDIEVPKDFLK